MSEDVFEDIDARAKVQQENMEQFDRDLNDAMRLLMKSSQGRVFVNWLIEGQDPRAIMRRVMKYVEVISV